MLANRLPIAVPLPEWLVEVGSPSLPLGASGYRRLPGERLSQDVLSGLWLRLASDVAGFLVALHEFPLGDARSLGVPEADRDDGEFEALRAEVLPLLRDVLSKREYEVVVAWSDSFLGEEEIYHFPSALRHGDLWYGNMLVNPRTRRLSAVLDWDNAAIGDPAWDLARQLHLGSRFATAVLRVYRASRRGRDAGLRQRIRRRWELLEFEGVRTAARLDDTDELHETIGKLRAGPILHGV